LARIEYDGESSMPKGSDTTPQEELSGISPEDMQALKELASWWRLRKSIEQESRATTTNTQKQSTRRNVYLPDDLWEKLKEQADYELRSVSDLVREAVRLYLGS